MSTIRIGSGAGFGGDRIEPAIDIMEQGEVDYIIFECLAERTIALAQKQKLKNPNLGFNELLEYRMKKILPVCKENNVKVITNMGASNPIAATKVIKNLANSLGIKGLKIAAVVGDDVFCSIPQYSDSKLIETGEKLKSLHSEIISANAYIGIEGIVQALENGADIVITGRVSDPSLVLGPLVYEFGWDKEDFERLGKGTLAGHLLECGSQVTGGYFADPGYKDVPELWNVGFPIAEIEDTGDFTLSKLHDTGGLLNEATVKEQVLYEVHDPSNYLTPDVIADFSKVQIEQIGINEVKVTGATGKKKTGQLKTSIAYTDGYIVEGEISYGASGSYPRAKLAAEIVNKRLDYIGVPILEKRFDFIGVNSLYQDFISDQLTKACTDFKDVRLRVAAKTLQKEDAEWIGYEVEALMTNGPAGGGGVRVHVKEVVAVASILIPEEEIQVQVIYEEV